MKKEEKPMKDPKEKILALAPLAVKEVERILEDDHSPPNARVQAIDIILNRTYGKPEGILKLETEERSPEEAAARIRRVAERIRKERNGENLSAEINEGDGKDERTDPGGGGQDAGTSGDHRT